MRILAVNYEYTLSGSTLILLRLAEHLRQAGHDVSTCAMVRRDGPIKDAYRERGFTVLEPPFSVAADVAICNTIMTAPQVVALSEKAKTIWWIHEGANGLAHLLRNPNDIAAFAQASATVFPIAYQRDSIYRSFIYDKDLTRFLVLPLGIPPVEPPSPLRDKRPELRIVSVGNIYPRKRYQDLIRAVAQYQAPARCTIAGKFYMLPDDCLKLIASNPDRFELTGELEHDAILRLVGEADVFCLPSDSEVLPLTTLEAAMLERPIILSDLPVYEGMWRHGRNCLVYPVGAVGMLAQYLPMLAGSPELRAQLGAAARRTAEPYTEAAFFARFDALLHSL